MAKRIDELGSSVALTGVEPFALVQSGQTLQATMSQVKDFTNPCDILCATVFIEHAQVLTLNSVPVQIIAAQGSGKYIQVLSVAAKKFSTTAYSTSTDLKIITEDALVPQYEISEILNVAGDVFFLIPMGTTFTYNAIRK
jgi:hypothetical protein